MAVGRVGLYRTSVIVPSRLGVPVPTFWSVERAGSVGSRTGPTDKRTGMLIAITDEHQALGTSVRTVLADHAALAANRALLEADAEPRPSFLGDMAALGWLGIHLPEAAVTTRGTRVDGGWIVNLNRSHSIATVPPRRRVGARCTVHAGMPVGDRYEGGAVQASARVVETFDVPMAGAAPARGGPPDLPPPRRRVPQRVIEIVGIVLGIALIATVARSRGLSNDEFWSLAAGQWMVAHHSFMGLDPFSYTESHRRWVTDEWGSEIALAELFRGFGNAAYTLYAVVLGGLCLVISATYARALGARGGRVAAIVLLLAAAIAGTVAGDRGLDFSLVWLPLELLALTKARTDPAGCSSFPHCASSGSTHTGRSCSAWPSWESSWGGRSSPSASSNSSAVCASRPTPDRSHSLCWAA